MKAILMSAQKDTLKDVYGREYLELIKAEYSTPDTVFDKNDCMDGGFSDVEAIFTTWGMERFSQEEIGRLFPSLRYVFYAAGSVRHFAKEFLDSGVRVFSAWQANAIPVAEYVFSQIVLSCKGMFRSGRYGKRARNRAHRFAVNSGGSYLARVGLVGAGAIGSLVAERLKTVDVEVFVCDPFLSDERAEELNVKKASMEYLFESCNVISNHLPDKEELTKIYGYELFSKMLPYSTFINTGRGRQVDERALAKALRKDKTRTAIVDVTHPEPLELFSGLRYRSNAFCTPHIAGSLGRELQRMARYMVDEAARISGGQPPLYEVTKELLEKMA